ncbi:hypothetical protein [Zunongwangia endophytica]|uniref:Membrane or secreted protein n=1 Tax=Zunongwangia endophytica TaxID=1808945 RepID=A0ABV8H3U2_9FLAO|nr:hypothetical protein [Zunongwangia endophytica]MDN3595757.1 hypothetical protein [Zunongwangia endophytica]
MKILFSVIAFSIFQLVSAQKLESLEGSWELISENKKPAELTTVRIYQDGFFAEGTKKGDYEFIDAKGGKYTTESSSYTEQFEFSSQSKELVGSLTNLVFEITNDTLKFEGERFSQIWLKIGDEKTDLTGVWIITGREKDSEMQEREIGDRKTIKILSGSRFQWIAYNSATKEFFATGGGTFSANYGRYIENIEFFSKDDFRVGASLNFDYQILNEQWHHRGKSSNGDPIYEIWSPYEVDEITKE